MNAKMKKTNVDVSFLSEAYKAGILYFSTVNSVCFFNAYTLRLPTDMEKKLHFPGRGNTLV